MADGSHEYDHRFRQAEKVLFDVSGPENPQNDDIRYPEALLHESQGAFKLYSSFQRYTRQFVAEDTTRHIVRWQGLELEAVLRSIVDQWTSTDRQTPSENTPSSPKKNTAKSSRMTANGLFSWSSGDVYIETRKREKQGPVASITKHYSNGDREGPLSEETAPEGPKTPVGAKLKLGRSSTSLTNNLNRVIERESSRFIHDRIQLIKAHHSEQISKKIHERKRKDHELHLQRLKEKEEEYERALQAAMTEQNHAKNTGFFGSLFGLSNSTAAKAQESDTASLHSLESQRTDQKSSPPGRKNKRFSFLPATSLWGAPQKKDNTPEDIFDISKETNDIQLEAKYADAETQDSQNEPEKEYFDPEADQQQETSNISSADPDETAKTNNVPVENHIAPFTEQASNATKSQSPVTAQSRDDQNSNSGPHKLLPTPANEPDDDFDEFSVFASAPPTKTPPLERRFMRLETGLSHPGTLIDLSGPETPSKNTADENLINL